MAFNNNRQQNAKINATTKVVQMYNPTGEDAGTLTLGYWNDFATIRINPALAPNEQKDGKMYNYELSASVLLNAESVSTINHGIQLLEAQLKKEKPALRNISLRTQGFIIKLGGAGDYEGIEDFYIAIFEVNDKNVEVGSIFYPFTAQDSNENTLLLNYDSETGKAKKRSFNAQWSVFKQFFKQANETLISGGAHGSTHQTKIQLAKLSTTLDMTKNLIEMGTLGGGRTGSSTGNTGGSNLGGAGFGGRRKRNIVLDEDTTPAKASTRGRSKPKEEKADDISDIENEMLSEMEEIED